MIKTLLTTSLFAALGLAQVGCNQQAAQQAQAQNDLAKAVTLIETAERGFIPEDQKAGEGADDALAHRNQELGKALTDLDAAIASGSPQQQAAAGQLKAMVLLSDARFQTREALAAYAELAPQAVALMRYLINVDRGDAGVAALQVDESAMLQQLAAESQRQSARQQQLTQRADELKRQLAALQAEVQQHKTEAQQASAVAADLRSKAFTAEGDARFDLADQAADSTLAADKASAAADKVTSRIDKLDVQLRLVDAELKGVDLVITRLEERSRETRERESQRVTARSSAEADQTKAAEELVSYFNQMTEAYAQRVDQPLLAAGERAAEAVATLRQAVNAAPRASRAAVEQDLLAAFTTQAHVLTEHALAAQNFGQTISVVIASGDRLLPAVASQFKQTADDLTQKQGQIIDQARQVITDGVDLANRLGDEAALTQKAFLEAYEQRLNGSDLRR